MGPRRPFSTAVIHNPQGQQDLRMAFLLYKKAAIDAGKAVISSLLFNAYKKEGPGDDGWDGAAHAAARRAVGRTRLFPNPIASGDSIGKMSAVIRSRASPARAGRMARQTCSVNEHGRDGRSSQQRTTRVFVIFAQAVLECTHCCLRIGPARANGTQREKYVAPLCGA